MSLLSREGLSRFITRLELTLSIDSWVIAHGFVPAFRFLLEVGSTSHRIAELAVGPSVQLPFVSFCARRPDVGVLTTVEQFLS